MILLILNLPLIPYIAKVLALPQTVLVPMITPVIGRILARRREAAGEGG